MEENKKETLKTERNQKRGDFKKRPLRPREEKLYDEAIISVNRITKVTKGGRIMRFSATVVVGDRKGKVGIGSGKAKEVPDAINKAKQKAVKNMVKISLDDNRTIPHEAIGVEGASKVLIKPAKEGTGIKAGGPVRSVLELAGVKDILSKSLGSSKKLNMAQATLNALKSQRTIEQVAKLRGKKVEEIR